jgi:hypothetical protein
MTLTESAVTPTLKANCHSKRPADFWPTGCSFTSRPQGKHAHREETEIILKASSYRSLTSAKRMCNGLFKRAEQVAAEALALLNSSDFGLGATSYKSAREDIVFRSCVIEALDSLLGC